MSDRTETVATLRTLLGQLSARHDWAGLLTASRQAAAAFPGDWEIAYHEGRALLETGAYAEAEQFLHRCMERFPAYPQFLVLYCYVGGRSLEPPAALARWLAMHGRMPLAPGLNLGVAQAYLAAGQLEEAERFLSEAMQRFPGNPAMQSLYADLASRRQDWDAAAARWQSVRAASPERVDAAIGEIGALRQGGRFEEAEQAAEQALRVHPDNVELITSYAAVAAAREDWRDAAERLQRLLALAPDNLAATLGLVGALQRQGLLERAEQAALAGIERHPDNEALLTAYAAIATHGKLWKAAAERWGVAYERCPPRASTYWAYVRALGESEQFVRAEEISAEAVGFAPEDKGLLVQRAHLAEVRGDGREAEVRWQALKRKYPEDAEIAESARRARRMMQSDIQRKTKDDAALSHVPIRGSMRPPERPKGPPRAPMSLEPTALDLLLTGAKTPEALRPPPGPTRNQVLWHRIKKMFRGP